MQPPASPRYRRYVLGLLVVAYALSFVDRQILAILLDDIRADIGATDEEMGMLYGLTFALFYTIAGIPIARWADVGNRRTVIAIGIATWSAFTALQGAARAFMPLCLARIGVGVGEAALSPPAHSLISDYFPPHRRNTAMAIYATGIYIGILLAYQLGGALGDAVGWRMTLVYLGIPGIFVALLIQTTVREPAREIDRASNPALFTSLATLMRLPAFRSAAFGAALASFAGYSMSAFTASYFQRAHAMTKTEVGSWLGITVGVGGVAGAFLGGWLADRLARRDPRWSLRLPALSAALTVPACWAVLLADDKTVAIVAYAPYAVLTAMYLGPVFSTVQRIVPPPMRATAAAVMLFVLNLIGLGLGPLVTGAWSDAFADLGRARGLGRSLMIAGSVGFGAAALFLDGSRHLRNRG